MPNRKKPLTPTPPMGWNSYDSFGCCINEKYTLESLELFAEKYKPFGYEYFVIDNGWFAEYEINPSTGLAYAKPSYDVNIDEYGRFIPSPTLFPNGLEPVIKRAHELGVKFGVHLMRGIPLKAFEQNTRIKGTTFRAYDITDRQHYCSWCQYTRGVDMGHPGGQLFYNSVLELLASWGIDFIKVDDITYFPEEVEGYANAIEACGRDIVLSLSPGGDTSTRKMHSYVRANMLRTTEDIWDDKKSLERGFKAWKTYSSYAARHTVPDGFWFDMDMIPFGNVCVWNPAPVQDNHSQLPSEVLFSGQGFARHCAFSKEQMRTFITQRAMAASPLFAGGDLRDMDDYSWSLLTKGDMLECNQNGIMGVLVGNHDNIDVWYTPSRENNRNGWLGLFNLDQTDNCVTALMLNIIGRCVSPDTRVKLVWQDREVRLSELEGQVIAGNDVLFLSIL